MPTLDFRVDFDAEQAVAPVYGQPMVFHCHHYNTFLQQTIEDPDYVDGPGILIQAAREVAAEQMHEYFQAHPEVKSAADQLAIAAELFKTCGFGVLDFGPYLAGEPRVVLPHSHYAEGWLGKFGQRETPCCFFATGFVAGVLDVVAGTAKGLHQVKETACRATGGDRCELTVGG